MAIKEKYTSRDKVSALLVGGGAVIIAVNAYLVSQDIDRSLETATIGNITTGHSYATEAKYDMLGMIGGGGLFGAGVTLILTRPEDEVDQEVA